MSFATADDLATNQERFEVHCKNLKMWDQKGVVKDPADGEWLPGDMKVEYTKKEEKKENIPSWLDFLKTIPKKKMNQIEGMIKKARAVETEGSPHAVANYLIFLSDVEEGDGLTSRRLQNLLFYMQGFALVFLNRPLFQIDIMRRRGSKGGICIEPIETFYSQYGNDIIPKDENYEFTTLEDDEKELIDDVWNSYHAYSCEALNRCINEDLPHMLYKSTGIVDLALMKKYFKENLLEEVD